MHQYSHKNEESPGICPVWKKRGETLAMLLERVRHEGVVPTDASITYAGRLDPMAEGVVLLLINNARFEKDKYTSLDKDYVFEILFGISTDTYDVLGRIQDVFIKIPELERIVEVLENVQRMHLPYPPYASKPVNGQPLYVHARRGSLPDEMPMQKGEIKHIQYLSSKQIRFGELVQDIISDIKKVQGDFRQEEIIADWVGLEKKVSRESVTIVTCNASVTSGVYIRSIAHEFGKMLGIPTLAYSIVRTRVGDFTIDKRKTS